MLGNFSFGDYFKEQAIEHAWELLTKDFELPKEKLSVTVFNEDEDSFRLWKKIAGLSEEKIIKISTSDNCFSDRNFKALGFGVFSICIIFLT